MHLLVLRIAGQLRQADSGVCACRSSRTFAPGVCEETYDAGYSSSVNHLREERWYQFSGGDLRCVVNPL